jgi:hypothetical protein
MPKITPAQVTDPEEGRAIFNRELARLKTTRPELDRLRAEVDALAPLEPTGIAEIDNTSSYLTSEARKYLADYAINLAEFETLFTATLAGDRATVTRSAAKVRRAAVLGLQSSAVTLRALKVLSSGGDEVEAAKMEAAALVVDGNVALLRLRLQEQTQPEVGQSLSDISKSIYKQLPVARSIIQNDARTFGDPPIGGVPDFVKINRIEWRMLELCEQFASAAEKTAPQLSSGKMAEAEIDMLYAQASGLMKEIISLAQQIEVTTSR